MRCSRGRGLLAEEAGGLRCVVDDTVNPAVIAELCVQSLSKRSAVSHGGEQIKDGSLEKLRLIAVYFLEQLGSYRLLIPFAFLLDLLVGIEFSIGFQLDINGALTARWSKRGIAGAGGFEKLAPCETIRESLE